MERTITDNPVSESYSRKPLPTLRDMVAVLFRQRMKMLVAFLLVIVLAVLSGKWIPTYEAKMKVMVLRQRTDAIMSSSASMPAPFTGDMIREEDLNSEVELLNSNDLLRRVVRTTALSKTSDSDVKLERAVQKLAKDLQVEAPRKSNVIAVSYRNRDPQLAAQVLQALSQAYVQKHLEMRHSSGEFAFFDQQARQYQNALNQAQARLTEFTESTGVVSAQTERDNALGHANEFNATAYQAQTAIQEAERRVQILQAQLRSTNPRITTTVRTADNPQLLQQMKTTLLNLELKKIELLTKYEPTYRLVREVDQQIADTKAALAAETSKPLRDESTGENPNYQWVQQELTRARADLSGLKARQISASSIAGKYHQSAQRLDRDQIIQQQLLQEVKTQQDSYLLYAQKREEARINDALDQRGIVNVATAEQPVVPAVPTQSLTNFALATLLLSGAFSVAVAFAVDFMNPTFRTPDELANYLEIPVLAALPKVLD